MWLVISARGPDIPISSSAYGHGNLHALCMWKRSTVTKNILEREKKELVFLMLLSLESRRVFQNLLCFVLLYNKLMTGPLENSEFCFPRISMFFEYCDRGLWNVTIRLRRRPAFYRPRSQFFTITGAPICIRNITFVTCVPGLLVMVIMFDFLLLTDQTYRIWITASDSLVIIFAKFIYQNGHVHRGCLWFKLQGM